MAFSDRVIGGMNLDAVTGPSPADSDTGSTGTR